MRHAPGAFLLAEAACSSSCLQVQHVVEMPQNDGLTLLEASRLVRSTFSGQLESRLHSCHASSTCSATFNLLVRSQAELLPSYRICNRDIVNRVQQVICFAVRGCRLGTSIWEWSQHFVVILVRSVN